MFSAIMISKGEAGQAVELTRIDLLAGKLRGRIVVDVNK